MEDINNTGLNFIPGQSIKTSDLNTLNDIINDLVDAVNILRHGLFNLNVELNIFTPMSLEEAVRKTTRRSKGMKLRFLGFEGKYLEYSFIGGTITDDDWNNLDNWVSGIAQIDGGTW